MLRTNVDKVCYIISLATQWTGKEEPIYKGGSALSRGLADDPGGDSPLDPIVEYSGDPTVSNLSDYLTTLGDDERADLLALLWIGRGDGAAADWDDLCRRADEEVARSNAIMLLLDSPHLGQHLEDALEQLGYQCPEDRAEDGAAGPGRSMNTGRGFE